VGTGGSGQVDVDAQGRVLLEFPWDRGDGKEGKSQHRVHVAAPWAGAGWGTIHLPRIGQLVLVEFLEGDPDRPIITGRVYSQNHAFPYALPENKTQSGTKSRSLGDGAGAENFNELRFEDKKGSEHVFLQAEKDLTENVKHDRTTTIQHNDHCTVVGGGGDKKGQQKLVVQQGDQLLLVEEGDQVFEDKQGNQALYALDGKQMIRIDKGPQDFLVGDGTRTVDVQKGDNVKTISGDDTTSCSSFKVDAQQTIELEAQSKIVLKCGGSTITLEPAAITVKTGGASIKLEAAQVTITAPQVTVKGNGKLALQGPMIEMAADAMLTVKGAIAQVTGSGMLKLGGGVTMAG
jgi:type VI secretion system secreted protein VgrG